MLHDWKDKKGETEDKGNNENNISQTNVMTNNKEWKNKIERNVEYELERMIKKISGFKGCALFWWETIDRNQEGFWMMYKRKQLKSKRMRKECGCV